MTTEKTGNGNLSQRIATNSMLLFVRMLFITIINLYSVRFVLAGLGAIDYGIFNAVAGVVMMSSFLSGVMELSIQRFYSIALGKKDKMGMNEIFSLSLRILFVIAVVLLVLFETVGIWFLETKLNIPVERMGASRMCFQFAIFTFVISIMQIPFSSALFAHENMEGYALISTIDCLLKVFVAVLIGYVMIDLRGVQISFSQECLVDQTAPFVLWLDHVWLHSEGVYDSRQHHIAEYILRTYSECSLCYIPTDKQCLQCSVQ